MDMEMVLGLVKARLNRPPGDTALDAYFKKRIEGAAAKLKRTGIHLTESADDMMLLVDYTVWQYQNRDKPGDMPDWLRLPNMDESTLEDTQIAVSDGAEITDFQKDGTHIVANIATEQAASLTVPLFAFDGYEAKLDGQTLDWTQDDRARLTVRLPENARGRLEIRYVGKAIWRAADAVSAATLIGLLFWMKKGEKKACRTH